MIAELSVENNGSPSREPEFCKQHLNDGSQLSVTQS